MCPNKEMLRQQYPCDEYLVTKSEEELTPVAIQNNNKTQSVAEILADVPGGCTIFMLRFYEDDIAISDEWTHVVVKKPAPIKTRHPLPSNNQFKLPQSTLVNECGTLRGSTAPPVPPCADATAVHSFKLKKETSEVYPLLSDAVSAPSVPKFKSKEKEFKSKEKEDFCQARS